MVKQARPKAKLGGNDWRFCLNIHLFGEHNFMRKILMALAFGAWLCSSSGLAQADVVEFTWVTTVSSASGNHPGVAGEQMTTTIRVDNGGNSLLSQFWTTADFVSYRAEGASGWFFEGYFAQGGGVFSTDAAGNVLTVGNWSGNWPNENVVTSWGATLGGWWNNGFNEVHAVDSPFGGVFADNVGDNLLASSWSASFAGIPEPGSFAALAGLLLFVASRRSRPRINMVK